MKKRIFIAINFPKKEILTAKLAQMMNEIKQLPMRWVKPEILHLTLSFLGEIEENDLAKVKKIVEKIASLYPPFVINLSGIGIFPDFKKPRILWIGAQEETGTLIKLQENLRQELVAAGFTLEEKKYQPHITIGRIKEKLFSSGIKTIQQFCQKYSQANFGESFIESIDVMESMLLSNGPVYRVLETIPLTLPSPTRGKD